MEEFDELELLNEARMQLKEENLTLADDHLICECLCVSAGEIRELLKEENINKNDVTKDYLTATLNLGKGCSGCLKDFSYWIKKI